MIAYIVAARTRAGRRRSRWNLLLIPCYALPWLLLTLGSLVGLGKAYALIHAVGPVRILPDTIGGILMALGALFAWLCPAMIGANVMVASVGPARRALDREAVSVAGADRATANSDLLRLSFYVTSTGVAVALIGLIIPW